MEELMKTQLFILSGLLLAPIAFAKVSQEGFEKRKAEALSRHDEAKACISSAQNPEALRECRKKMREEHRRRRGEKIDERIQKLEERKAQIQKSSN
jgi:hypothetical protein